MRKNTKKAVCIFFAVLLLVCSFPISAFAVDPVSASVIANSFAQAITAYGASNGVSLTFDGVNSGNTEQIGQSVHELWARFRAGQQTADDYDTIAAAVFPGLYNKVVKAGGTAVVGMSIAQQYMPDIDGFWNWLLSGPAEMVKVDNAYQWNVDPITNQIEPVTVYSTGLMPSIPKVSSSVSAEVGFESSKLVYDTKGYTNAISKTVDAPYYVCLVNDGSNVRAVVYSQSRNACNRFQYIKATNKYSYDDMTMSAVSGSTDVYYGQTGSTSSSNLISTNVPVYSSRAAADAAFLSWIGDPTYSNVNVQPYVGDAVAKPVPLPDVGDPDYGPVTWTGDLDVPWNDTLFGDGTGSLTDAQKGAITEELDGVIENDGTLVLEGDKTAPGPDEDEDDPPSDDPDDYGVIGLENIFPFCIPFDIYNFLNALAATPTAPHFTATLQLPSALGGAQTIDLDFDNPTFNQLAQLLRLLELLAFIVGLALLTRSMFIRG